MNERAERWLALAETDLDAAQELETRPALRAIAAFHCQQAVEKALKGLITLGGGEPPRVHDLPRLRSLVQSSTQERLDETAVELTNETYVETRYPVFEDREPITVTAERLSRMVELAKTTVALLRSELTP